jgi:hypothetical protein
VPFEVIHSRIPRAAEGKGFAPAETKDNDMTDFAYPDVNTQIPRGHGTFMARIAAGSISEVAPNADLCLMKWTGAVKHNPPGKPGPSTEKAGGADERIMECYTRWQAVVWILEEAIEMMETNKLPGRGRTVFLISHCMVSDPVHACICNR